MVSETRAECCSDGDYVVVILLYLCEHTVWISVQCNLIVYVIILLVYYKGHCGPGSSIGIATDYGLDGPGSNPGWDENFRPSRPAPGVKCSRGVLLTTHLLLVPRSWKGRAIPLPTLWVTPGL